MAFAGGSSAAGQCAGRAAATKPAPALPRRCCRAVKELHRETAAQLGVDATTCEEVEGLLTQLQQLLVGISIMQVGGRVRAAG